MIHGHLENSALNRLFQLNVHIGINKDQDIIPVTRIYSDYSNVKNLEAISVSASNMGVGILSIENAGINVLSLETAGVNVLSVETLGVNTLSVQSLGANVLSVESAGANQLSVMTINLGNNGETLSADGLLQMGYADNTLNVSNNVFMYPQYEENTMLTSGYFYPNVYIGKNAQGDILRIRDIYVHNTNVETIEAISISAENIGTNVLSVEKLAANVLSVNSAGANLLSVMTINLGNNGETLSADGIMQLGYADNTLNVTNNVYMYPQYEENTMLTSGYFYPNVYIGKNSEGDILRIRDIYTHNANVETLEAISVSFENLGANNLSVESQVNNMLNVLNLNIGTLHSTLQDGKVQLGYADNTLNVTNNVYIYPQYEENTMLTSGYFYPNVYIGKNANDNILPIKELYAHNIGVSHLSVSDLFIEANINFDNVGINNLSVQSSMNRTMFITDSPWELSDKDKQFLINLIIII